MLTRRDYSRAGLHAKLVAKGVETRLPVGAAVEHPQQRQLGVRQAVLGRVALTLPRGPVGGGEQGTRGLVGQLFPHRGRFPVHHLETP